MSNYIPTPEDVAEVTQDLAFDVLCLRHELKCLLVQLAKVRREKWYTEDETLRMRSRNADARRTLRNTRRELESHERRLHELSSKLYRAEQLVNTEEKLRAKVTDMRRQYHELSEWHRVNNGRFNFLQNWIYEAIEPFKYYKRGCAVTLMRIQCPPDYEI